TRDYKAQPHCTIPTQVLFPQLAEIVHRYLAEKVRVQRPADIKDLFLAPYYGWVVERLVENIHGDVSQGESPEVPRYESTRGPGSTADVDFWTSRDVREVNRSHLNYVVADTKRWEQSAAYFIDTHKTVRSFVKNSGLGFAIPYLHNGQMHDYMPDFLVRLNTSEERYLILETKGYDPLEEVKKAAAERWVNAVNADGKYGKWTYRLVHRPTEIPSVLKIVADAS
ncbi:MAG: type III restriction endonuclease subunit R, partial [Verrucomicrobia bacterium]|nr:type III restriction endonuclease subunit R [Verrucomicrobiota bacterium]